MFFWSIYLRQSPNLLTWSSAKSVPLGSRVAVKLRNKIVIGIVVTRTTKPVKITVQAIEDIYEESFIPEVYLQLAQKLAVENYARLWSVLSLLVPNNFLLKRDPVKYEQKIHRTAIPLPKKLGTKQQLLSDLLAKNPEGLDLQIVRQTTIPLSTIKNWIKEGIIYQQNAKISLPNYWSEIKPRSCPWHQLTTEQSKALKKIEAEEKPSLLFGITGSGKTEIYRHLSAKILQKKTGQVLILVPEIALTPQLIEQFRSVFGEQVAVWHSKLSEADKTQEWQRLRSGQARLLIGTRSSCLVSLTKLKLIIIDEEHEWNYKNSSNPRFLTHDVAEWLSCTMPSKLVLASGTPRSESFFQVEEKRWSRIDLSKKVLSTKKNDVQLIDLREESKAGNFSALSRPLQQALRKIKEGNKQAILFLNRRGWSASTMCRWCGQILECPNCDMPLKLHVAKNYQQIALSATSKLICHVCGHLENWSDDNSCPKCQKKNFCLRGWGTQQVEQDLNKLMPDLKVLRADSDIIRKRNDFAELWQKFRNYEADVLIGTQMIAKGLDFPRVTLVGIIFADLGLGLPDFRAPEKTFQLLAQVSGRAGRRNDHSQIMVQTFHPKDDLFVYLKKGDVAGWNQHVLEQRKLMHFSPYGQMAKVIFADYSKEKAWSQSKKYHQQCQKHKDWDTFWAPSFWPRLHNKYFFHVLLRSRKLEDLHGGLALHPPPSGSKVDINPVSLLDN